MKQKTRLWHEMTYVFYNFAAESKRIMESGSKKQGKKKMDILNSLDPIVNATKNSKLSDEFYKKVQMHKICILQIRHLKRAMCVSVHFHREK